MTLPNLGENLTFEQISIAAGASESDPIELQGRVLIAIIMPTAWTAATLAYKAGLSSLLQPACNNAGKRLLTTVDANTFVAVPLDEAIYAPAMSIVSTDGGDPVAAVNQAAARTLVVILRKFLS